jgi:ubiquinone/menaquinone biosynthesis C-methylase UbiE
MAMGLHTRASPERLVAFDIVPTDVKGLLDRGRAEGVLTDALPAGLEFRQSEVDRINAEDAEFDFVYSWSAFEHIETPIEVLTETRRVLRPAGQFFLQLWPFYHSAKGSHLWDWFPEDFHHLTANQRDIVAEVEQSHRHGPEMTRYMIREFEHLNRITLEELQRAVLAAGFEVRRLELITAPAILAPELGRYAWADLGIGGIKFLATRRP